MRKRLLFALPVLATLTMAASSGDGKNRTVQIHNHAQESIFYLRWSNTGTDSYGADKLGDTVIRPNSYRTFVIDDGSGACRYDFHAKLESGEVWTATNVNVCEVSKISIGNYYSD